MVPIVKVRYILSAPPHPQQWEKTKSLFLNLYVFVKYILLHIHYMLTGVTLYSLFSLFVLTIFKVFMNKRN